MDESVLRMHYRPTSKEIYLRGAWMLVVAVVAVAVLWPQPCQGLQLGLCEDYPEETRSISRAREDLLLMKTNHISVLRIAFGWDAIEPERDRYDWTFWDDFVRSADEFGITLIPYVCYTPVWAAHRKTANPSTQPPSDYEDFARFIRTIVQRYKGSIHSWEIWNEPDNAAYWSGSAAEYGQLLEAGSAAIRAADPNAKVVSGGLAWNLQFLKETFSNTNVAASVDVINLHNYYETWASEGAEQIDDYVGRAEQVLLRSNVRAPIWLAEVGYSSFRTNRMISEIYDATYNYEHTVNFQAASVFRMLTPLLSSSNVSLAAWYRITDLRQTEPIIGDVNNRHLGVLDQQRNPKPALAAFRFFNQLFAHGAQPIPDVRCCKPLSSDAEVYAFTTDDDKTVVLFWLKVVTSATPTLATNLIADTRREQISISLPPQSPRGGYLYNERGEKLGMVAATGGVVTLTVSGGTVNVVVLGSDE